MPNEPKRGFASDNNAGVHPKVLEAIAAANQGHVIAYGDDPTLKRRCELFREHFGKGVDVLLRLRRNGRECAGTKSCQ